MYKVSIKITTPDFELEKELELEGPEQIVIEQTREIHCADCGAEFPCRQESCSGDLVGKYAKFELRAQIPDIPIVKLGTKPVRGIPYHGCMIDEAQTFLKEYPDEQQSAGSLLPIPEADEETEKASGVSEGSKES